MQFGNLLAPGNPEALRQQSAQFPGFPSPQFPEHRSQAEGSIWHYIPLLLKHRWLLLACLLICGTVSAIISIRSIKIYEAAGRIAVNRENSEAMGIKSAGEGLANENDYDYMVALDTQVRILQSDALAIQVIRQLQLDKNPAFATVPAGNSSQGLQPATMDVRRESQLLGTLRGGLSVSTIPRTRIIEIRYQHPDPKLAATIVNGLASVYIEQNFKTKFESTMRTSDWLSQQLNDLQLRVETSQQKLVEYQKEHGILGVDEKTNIVTAKLDELNKELTSAEADRIAKQSKYMLVQGGQTDVLSSSEPNSIMARLRSQEIDLANQLVQLNTQLGPSHPKVKEVNNQLQQTRSMQQEELHKLGDRARADFVSAQKREQMLSAAMEQQKQEANQLNESAIQYSLLKRDFESNRQLYEGLLQRLKEAGVTAGLHSNNIRVIDQARVPLSPIRPRVPRDIATGTFIGLLIGIGMVFCMEALDNTIRTSDQVENITNLPVVGVIPRNAPIIRKDRIARGVAAESITSGTAVRPGSSTNALAVLARPRSEVAESYRALRTAVLLSTPGAPPKVILVTSPLPQEGKTTTSVNAAIVLAQRGAKVLIIDADLRRPTVNEFLGIVSNTGLSKLLSGSATQSTLPIQHESIPNLYVMPAGPPAPHPAELVGSAAMASCLERWRSEFDHIIIDSPPALSVTDAVILSVQADATLIVTRSGRTSKTALRRTRDLLARVNARILGVVINGVDTDSAEYGYYYYGKKQYYGSGYYHEGS